MAGLLLLLLLLLGVALQFPAVQTSLVNRVAGLVTAETGAEASVDRVMLRLSGALSVKGLSVQDVAGDTLLYAEEVRVRVRPFALRKNHLNIRAVHLRGVVAHIYRVDGDERFNVALLFDSGDQKPPVVEEGPDAQGGAKPWTYSLGELTIRDIRVSYDDHLSGMALHFALRWLVFEPEEINLAQMRFHAKRLLLEGPELFLAFDEGSGGKSDEEPSAFEMPDIDVFLGGLHLTDLLFQLEDRVAGTEMRLEASLSISGLVARDDTLGLGFHASRGRLDERLEISELSFLLAVGQAVSVDAWRLRTAGSSMHARLVSPISLFEPGLPGLDDPGFDLLLHELVIGEDVAAFFAGQQLAEQFFNDQRRVEVTASASGRLGDFQIDHLNVAYADLADLQVEGAITGLPDLAQTTFTLPGIRLKLAEAVWSDEAIQSIAAVPLAVTGQVVLEASLQGSPDDLRTRATAYGQFGQLGLVASYLQDRTGVAVYEAQLDVKDLRAGELVGAGLLQGGLTASLYLAGKGVDPVTAEVAFELVVDEVTANQYVYRDLMVDGTLSEGRLGLSGRYHDEALFFDLEGMLDLAGEHLRVRALADLLHLDAQALHLSADQMTLGTRLDADVVLTADDFFDGSISLSETWLHMNGHPYTIDSITLVASSLITDSLQTYVLDLRSPIFEASYAGNISPGGMPAIFTRHFVSYLEGPDSPEEPAHEHVRLHFDIRVKPSRWYTQVFFPELHAFEEIFITGSYSSEANMFSLQGELPFVHYGGIDLQQLSLYAHTDRRQADMRLDLGSLGLDGTIFRGLRLESQLQDSAMVLKLFAGGQFDDPWMLAQGDLREAEVFFRGSDLAVLFSEEGIDRFTGVLDGTVVLGNFLEEEVSVKADLHIGHLGFNQDTIGDLSLQLGNPEVMRLVFAAALRNHGNRLDIEGAYLMGEDPLWDVRLGIDSLDLSGFEGFTGGELQQLEGLLSGRVRVSGPVANLDYSGELNLSGVRFLATFVNVAFSMPDESIVFDRDQITFRDFSFFDAQGRPATLSGRIVTTDWRNPLFNLSLVSRNFLALHVPPGQNDQFSGRVLISSDLRLHGDLQSPVLGGSLKLNEGTNFLIKVPQALPEAIGDEGVVLFVGPDSIAREPAVAAADPLTTSLRNLDVSINVEVDPATDVRIVIDEYAGDFLEVKGGGMISYGTDPGGRVRLSGRYELVEGTYLLTFYDILSRQFAIVRGSRFLWTGDPMNPDVDLTAIYQVRTTARELFESWSAPGGDQDMPGMRQQFPFEVLLKMSGPLMRPEISFGIQLPPEHRQALDGRLQSRLDELARNESALNKQVFALLIFGHFMAENPFASALEGPGFTATARTSASRILTQQLNRLSDQYIRGVDIQFDIESFEDETAAGLQGRTQLNLEVSKDFFDERVRVTVGGNIELEDDTRRQTSAGDIAGDFLIEYLLNEQGNLVLKGFRKKEFGDLFEGQVIETGVALLFNRTYNRFRELFGRKEEED